MFDLVEPEDVVPAWKRWSAILVRPEGLYDTRPAEGGNKAAKLKAICEALRTAKRVWLATDCDRERQLIGQEILEHYKYRGEVMRVLFTARDSQTIRDAFGRAKPNTEYARLYAAAVARRQTAFRPAGSIAPQSTAPRKRSRKQMADIITVEAAPAQPKFVTGTPLRITYGNKEVAMKLGARYGSAGWYAPPGVDLAAFSERGWL